MINTTSVECALSVQCSFRIVTENNYDRDEAETTWYLIPNQIQLAVKTKKTKNSNRKIKKSIFSHIIFLLYPYPNFNPTINWYIKHMIKHSLIFHVRWCEYSPSWITQRRKQQNDVNTCSFLWDISSNIKGAC
jgi:hypothetical protein